MTSINLVVSYYLARRITADSFDIFQISYGVSLAIKDLEHDPLLSFLYSIEACGFGYCILQQSFSFTAEECEQTIYLMNVYHTL